MKDFLIALAMVFPPLFILVLSGYLMGWVDGRLAEQRRRAMAADGLVAKKNREGCIRL